LVCSTALLVMSCIVLQRYYLYRTKSCPASQAPSEAATYFTSGYYKHIVTIGKRERKALINEIKIQHKHIVQNHIPPLVQDDEVAKMEAACRTGLTPFTSMARDRRTDGTRTAYSGSSMASNSTFHSATLGDTPQLNKTKPSSMSSRKDLNNGVSFMEMRRRHVANRERRGSSPRQHMKYNQSSIKSKADKSTPSYVYRRQAIEYSLNIDKALIQLDVTDKRLKRQAGTDIAKHIKYVRNLKKADGQHSEYDALRLLNTCEPVAEKIRHARYGVEPFLEDDLQRTKNLVDEIVQGISRR